LLRRSPQPLPCAAAHAGATLTKGILCNWLVCIAVWQGNAAQDITGKLLGIWFPISAFVTSG
jgi:formate/nitrite transporter FocA (FNT family)